MTPSARSQCACSRLAASHSASGSAMAKSSASAFQYPSGVLSRATRPVSDPIEGTAFVSKGSLIHLAPCTGCVDYQESDEAA